MMYLIRIRFFSKNGLCWKSSVEDDDLHFILDEQCIFNGNYFVSSNSTTT